MREVILIMSWVLFGLADLAATGWFIFIFVNLFTLTMAWWIPIAVTVGTLLLAMVFLVTLVWAAS